MNIQLAQGLFRMAEERLSSRKENVSSPNDASVPQINVPDAQTVDNPKVSSEDNLMKVVYPPFFPIGNTQDILFIKGVKQLTGENVKSASSVTVEEQKAKQKDNNKAASPDTSAVKDKCPQVEREVNTGVVLDLKV
jgi:hypothetical protein